MRRMALSEYEALRAGAEVLAADAHGDKVLRRPDGRIIKLFRLKSLWSSALFLPYAKRFVRNTHLLQAKGFRTINVGALARVKELKRDLVVYEELPGQTLRSYLQDPATEDHAGMLARFAQLVADLHHQGILFRSIHFGNILVQPDRNLAIIDVADMRRRLFPLRIKPRLRNFHHMLRYAKDRDLLLHIGLPVFLDAYIATVKKHANGRAEGMGSAISAKLKTLIEP